jgi:hypothetical protein
LPTIAQGLNSRTNERLARREVQLYRRLGAAGYSGGKR